MDLFDLFARISIDLGDFERGLSDASSKFQNFSKNLTTIGKGMKDLLNPAVEGFKAVEGVGQKAADAVQAGLKGFAAISAAVGGFGAAAVKSGMTFDATMSEVSAISGATGDDFDSLRDKALEMGAKTKFSASEAGEAMTYMAMAGWKAEDMIGGIEGIMNLAAASGEDLASTSDIVTDALTAFGMTADESGHFADILAVASSNANTNVGMMGETFKYVAPIAGAMGYSAEDAALAIGLMANSGIKATQAGTALRSIITRMAKPTKQSAAAMDALGLSITDSAGNMKPLSEIIEDMRVGFSGLTESEKASYAAMLAGQEAMSGLLAIVGAAPEDVEKLTNAIYDCNGAAEKMAATMVDNLQGDITLLGSAFESLQIAISDSLTPTLREFAQFGQRAMSELLDGFQGNGVSGFMNALSGIVTDGVTMLVQKAPEFASVGLQFIEALADGLLNAGNEILVAGDKIAFTLIDGISTWLSTNSDKLLDIGYGLVQNIFNAFVSAGDVISENIGKFVPLIVNAFTAYHEALFTVGLDILGAIGQGLVENKDEIQHWASLTIENMVTSLRDNAPAIIEGGIALLEALVGAIVENLPLIFSTGAEIVGELIKGISGSMPALIVAVGAIIPYISQIIDVVGGIGKAVTDVINVVKGVGTAVSSLFSILAANPIVLVIAAVAALVAGFIVLWNNCEGFRNFWIGLWEGLQAAVSTAVDAIVGFFTSLVESIGAALSGLAEFVGGVFSSAWELVQRAWAAAGEFFFGIADGIRTVFESVTSAVGKFFASAWDVVRGTWEAVTGFFSDIAGGIQQAFETATSFLSDAFSAAWEAVQGAWNAAIGFFGNIWASISGTFSGVADFFGGLFTQAWEAVTSAWDGVTDYFGGVWESITSVFSGVWDKFKEIGGNIVSGLKDGIVGAWDAFTGWLGEKVGGIVDGVKGLLGIHSPSAVFAEIGENMMLGLQSGVDGESAPIDAQMLKVVDTMKNAFNGLSVTFSSIGQSAMAGLNQGLGGAIDGLQKKVASLMTGIAAAAKAALDIHSPSGVFADIGENMALGLAEGWDDQYSSIKRQIKRGMDFGTATVGLSANGSGYWGGNGRQAGYQQPATRGGDTYNFYSPKALDPVSAAREMKRARQQMALGYVGG